MCQKNMLTGVCGGTVLPVKPLQEDTEWRCGECGEKIGGDSAKNVMKEAETEVNNPDKADDLVEHLEKFLHQTSTLLHPTNYINISVKMKLGFLYGNCSKYPMASMARPLMERKFQVCQDVMNTLSRVEPGYSRWRGRVLQQLNIARLVITRDNWQKGATDKKHYDKALLEKQMLKMYLAFHMSLF